MAQISSEEYRMPAEWSRHAQTWMGWPDRHDNWRDEARPAQQAYTEVATAISQFEPVTVCANPAQVENARRMLPSSVAVEALEQDDAWFRDSGPSFVKGPNGEVAGVDWEFNGWGGDVIPSCENDKKIAAFVLSSCKVRSFRPNIVMEGGSFHVDGEGTLMTTEECLLHGNRNPSLKKEDIERVLKSMLGIKKVIWLPLGLVADEDTNGHVDNFACFSAPGKVLLSWPSTEDPEQLERSQAALEILEKETDAQGKNFEVTKLFLPPPLQYTDLEVASLKVTNCERLAGQRLAASYVNFYVCNGAVICPAFGGEAAETDKRAEKTLQEAFPDRKVVVIRSARDILLGGGNIHCITQQEAAKDQDGSLAKM